MQHEIDDLACLLGSHKGGVRGKGFPVNHPLQVAQILSRQISKQRDIEVIEAGIERFTVLHRIMLFGRWGIDSISAEKFKQCQIEISRLFELRNMTAFVDNHSLRS